MKVTMTEPVTTAAGIFGTKFAISSGLFGVISTAFGVVLVMTLTRPHSFREAFLLLASTVAFSIFGGAAAIDYFALQAWSGQAQGLAYLLCGLPAWVTVRAFFAWTEADKSATLIERITQIRALWKQ